MRAHTWERPCEYMWATCEPHWTVNLLDPHLRRSRLQNCLLRKFSSLWYLLCSLNWDRLQNALSEPSEKLYLKQGPRPSLGPQGSTSARAEGLLGTGPPWGSFLAGQPLGQGLIGGPGGPLIFRLPRREAAADTLSYYPSSVALQNATRLGISQNHRGEKTVTRPHLSY